MIKKFKIFEKWITNVTDPDININYNESEMSKVVEYTKKYIEDNFDRIKEIYINNNYRITFHPKKSEFDDISLERELPFYYISFVTEYKGWKKIDITKDEFKYLSDFFYEIGIKFRKKSQESGLNSVLDEINPVKRMAKKYNL
jgi:hypothetical protein